MDSFLSLPREERRQALGAASDKSGRPLHLLEKDVWVVWTLEALFAAPFADGLVFKGGTSLSKAYRIIERFSEDLDLTYDIRRLLAPATPLSMQNRHRWCRDLEDQTRVGGSAPGWQRSSTALQTWSGAYAEAGCLTWSP